MVNIDIVYNPFKVETLIKQDGRLIDIEGSKMPCKPGVRLQEWVDNLFDELDKTCNSQSYEINFHGLETDYRDVEEVAVAARERGYDIRLQWQGQGIAPIDERLDQVMQIFSEVRQDVRFEKWLNNSDVEKKIESAFDSDFDVYVVATMSSGKSTLINAMLGSNLLPALNEATTATIACIFDNDAMYGKGFNARRLSNSGDVLDERRHVTLETLAEWNGKKDTARIDIEGDIVGVRQRENVRLVITDTPGPNNSQDLDHKLVTYRAIEDGTRRPLILYILNATQLGINDDKLLLEEIASLIKKGGKQARDRFVFVVNKMDVFDPEKGEDIEAVLGRVRKYLQEFGIEAPRVYPVTANLARMLRVRDAGGTLTRNDRGELSKLEDLFNEEPCMDMTQYMPVSEKIRRDVNGRGLSDLLIKSGMPTLEAVVDDYIDRYALPIRVERAYEAFLAIIAQLQAEMALDEALAEASHNVEQLEKDVAELKEKAEQGFGTQAYKDELEASIDTMEEETINALHKVRAEGESALRKIGKEFSGEASIKAAGRRLEASVKQLEEIYEMIVVKYEEVFKMSQEVTKARLEQDYKAHVESVFSDVACINFGVMEGIKSSLQAFDLKLSISKEDVATRDVEIGRREVSVSKWYKPWSWGKTKTVIDYEQEKYVDLGEYWENHSPEITESWSGVFEAAGQHVKEGRRILIERMLEFMSREFDVRFGKLFSDIEFKVANKDKLEQELAGLREQKQALGLVQERLDKVLEV
ncbi:MAG: dynamin family protein [Pseudomonadota bacterium]|nr:dynamin family protein [Pseudomonadota bacterium]